MSQHGMPAWDFTLLNQARISGGTLLNCPLSRAIAGVQTRRAAIATRQLIKDLPTRRQPRLRISLAYLQFAAIRVRSAARSPFQLPADPKTPTSYFYVRSVPDAGVWGPCDCRIARHCPSAPEGSDRISAS